MRRRFRKLWQAIEGGHWLNRERVFGYCAVILCLEVIAAVFLTAGTYGWVVPLDKPTTTDFVSFYAAGQLADSGDAAAAYAQPRHFAAEQRAAKPGIGYVFFFYPPVFLLLCALFARLPYLAAFAAFEGATLILCLAAARRITGTAGWRNFIPLLAYPAIFINIGVGQNGLLTAALFAGATLLVDSRPILAGLLFGAVCYKPQYGLLIPVALIAGARWRAFGAAAAAVVALTAVSVFVFGRQTWLDFLGAIAGSHTTYESGAVDFAAFANVFGALRLVGASPVLAYSLQAATTLAMAALVASVWRRDFSLPLRAAALTAATVAAAPLSLFYDLTLAGIAIAWLVRDGRENGFLAWEKAILAFVFTVPLLSRGFATAWHLPLAALSPIALAGLCIAIARTRAASQRPDNAT